MNTYLKRGLLALLLLSSLKLSAAGGPPAWAGRPDERPGKATGGSGELSALEQFLGMDDQQLDKLLAAITRVRAMTPEERQRMREQIASFRQLSPEQREQIRRGWGWLTEQDRNDWPTMMRELPPEQRERVQKEIQSLDPDARAQRKHELLEAWRKQAADTK